MAREGSSAARFRWGQAWPATHMAASGAAFIRATVAP
jgi:hypothetical protein